MKITIFAGGVGGSKLVEGFSHAVKPDDITVIGNMGDDVDLHGLRICPDLDIVTYTLAGIVNPGTGWGMDGDTFHVLDALERLGQDSWFRLGDRDLATHIFRTSLIRNGARPTDVTRRIADMLGVHARIIPPTDSSVRTEIRTPGGWKSFQEYFVRDRCRDDVLDVEYNGASSARATPEAEEAIRDADLIVFAPSNPIASIGPILSIAGIRDKLKKTRAYKVAVSPLVGGRSLKGPSDRMMKALGFPATAIGVAQYYVGIIDVLVIDEEDETLAGAIRETGCDAHVLPTIMASRDDKIRLAEEILKLYDVPLERGEPVP